MEVHRATKIHNSKKGKRETKKTLAMAPTYPFCTIGTNIETKAVNFTSLANFLRRYRVNKKTRIIVGTVLEVEIGPEVTALGRRRTFVVKGGHHQHKECQSPHSGTSLYCY